MDISMKILILANNDVGLYNFRKELLEKLIEEKHSVYIALPGGDKIVKMMRMGCTFYHVEIDRRGMNPFRDLSLLRKYIYLIRKVNPDMVLTYTVKPNIYGGIACQLLQKKYLVNITGLGTAVENGGITAKIILNLYKIALRKASCVFFQNASNQKKMEEFHIRVPRAVLLPGSGVNLNEHMYEAYPPETEQIEFLFIGRVMKDKGIEELLKAAANVKKMYPNIIFRIAGDCEENYSERLKKLEEKEIIEYLGFRTDIHNLIKSSAALVLPSYHEGMANVLLEASSSGRPVLASKIPGCLEAFEEGITGIGFEAGNEKDLERVLKTFIAIPYERKKKMGVMARKKMEKEFDRRIVVNAYLKEIQNSGKETR